MRWCVEGVVMVVVVMVAVVAVVVVVVAVEKVMLLSARRFFLVGCRVATGQRYCSGPVADPGHPRMARATHG